MFLLPPVGGGETFEIKKGVPNWNKKQVSVRSFFTYMSIEVPLDIVQIEY